MEKHRHLGKYACKLSSGKVIYKKRHLHSVHVRKKKNYYKPKTYHYDSLRFAPMKKKKNNLEFSNIAKEIQDEDV